MIKKYLYLEGLKAVKSNVNCERESEGGEWRRDVTKEKRK
jgi:hypothetical protein